MKICAFSAVLARRAGLVALICALLAAGAAPAWAQDEVRVQIGVRSVDGLAMPATPAKVSVTRPDGSSFEAGTGFTAPPGSAVQVQLTGQRLDGFAFYRESYCRPQEQIAVAQAAFTVAAAGTFDVAAPENTHVLTLPTAVAREMTASGVDAVEQRFVELVNGARAQLGRPALAIDGQLSAVADVRATDTAIVGVAGHMSPFQCVTPETVAEELGVATGDGGLLEVVHQCAASAEKAWEDFRASSGHYAVLMAADRGVIGVGVADGSWAAVLASGLQVTGPVPARTRTSAAKGCAPSGGGGATGGGGDAVVLSMDRPQTATAGRAATISGDATPGTKIRVQFSGGAGTSRTATADRNGLWAVRAKLTRATRATASAAGAPAVSRQVQVRANAGVRRMRVRRGTLSADGVVLPAAKVRLTVRVSAGRVKLTRKVTSARSGRWTAKVKLPRALRGRKVTVKVTVPARRGVVAAGSLSRRMRS